MQVVAKLHAILRPFLLRRMKADVELMLPRKKEIIVYANMTEHQKSLQDHLINETMGKYLEEKLSIGNIFPPYTLTLTLIYVGCCLRNYVMCYTDLI